jgi:uncharacterized membrane protein
VNKGRLEAFSDGVIAIIITIAVLELHEPHGSSLANLASLYPIFLSYLLSFIYIGIYWTNHHHLLQASQHVNGGILWANLHLLFWLSLVPFVTGWMGENNFAPNTVALYGFTLLCAGFAFVILTALLVSSHGKGSVLEKAIGRDFKGKVSLIVYMAAIPLAYLNRWISLILYGSVAAMWLIPDRRIEKIISSKKTIK